MDGHILDRSGLASLDDLKAPAARQIFLDLEHEQDAFLSQQASFLSREYKWPRAPLHNWSRCWEYPYAYRAIRDELQSLRAGTHPQLADIGSGVTFFPFAVAKLGCQVVCTDTDPICAANMEQATRVVSAMPGQVSFRPCTIERLPFSDGECDAAYCISVLEHIQAAEQTIAEIFRILKPGALFCLTIDIGLRDGVDIGPERYAHLHGLLRERFVLATPERGIHPSRMLTSNTGPFPVPDPPGPTGPRLIARNLLRDYLGTTVEPARTYLLTVEGTLWRKPLNLK